MQKRSAGAGGAGPGGGSGVISKLRLRAYSSSSADGFFPRGTLLILAFNHAGRGGRGVLRWMRYGSKDSGGGWAGGVGRRDRYRRGWPGGAAETDRSGTASGACTSDRTAASRIAGDR